jgi:hypothetical protein
MKNKTCAAFLFDGFIDHQLSLTLAYLNKGGIHELETFSTRGQRVTSAGGLRVTPHTSLAYIQPEDFDVLLLPGGSCWEKGDNLEIFPLLMAIAGRRPQAAESPTLRSPDEASRNEGRSSGWPQTEGQTSAVCRNRANFSRSPISAYIIAIGEAVLGLADLGLLDNIPHTGCHPGYITRFCPEYTGTFFFKQQPCVSAHQIVTINNAALLPPGDGILGLFDTLQEIYANTHAFFDQEQQ